MKVLSALQAYRALAALLVVSSHAQLTTAYFSGRGFRFFTDCGEAGVVFFFVLSGFVMLWTHEADFDRPERAGPYLRKRLTRIYPVYWAVILMLLPFWMSGFGKPYHHEVAPLVKSLLLIPQDHDAHLSVAWTLTHEMLFYLAFAVFLFSRRAGMLVMAAWAVAVAVAEATGWNRVFPADFPLRAYNLLFLAGMAAAAAARRIPALRGRAGAVLFGAGNLVLASSACLHGRLEGDLAFMATFGTGSFLVAAGAASESVDRFFRRRKALLFLGAASYAIYLIHWPAMSIGGKALAMLGWLQPVPPPGLFLGFGLIGVVGGVLLHVAVERPLLRLLRPRARG